ncbi:MAG: hypothetical protein WCG52_02360 [bacterium]
MSRQTGWITVLASFFGTVVYNLLLPFFILRSRLIFVSASNNFDILPIAFWARMFRKPVLVDYYVSIFEWSCQLMKIVPEHSLRGRLYRISDRVAYRQKYLMHFNRSEIRHIGDSLGIADRSTECFVCPLFTRFDQMVKTIECPKLQKPFRFVWWGSSLPLHGISLIVSAFKALADARRDFELHLCFMGDSHRDAFLTENPAGSCSWLRCHTKYALKDGSLPNFVNQYADLGFSHFGVGEQAEYVGSNKVVECMALGRTCLLSDTTSNREIIGFDDSFFVCQRKVEEMVKTLVYILDNPEEVGEKGLRCREIFIKHYSEAVGAHRFGAILNTIQNQGLEC